jgi:hypothetical protein
LVWPFQRAERGEIGHAGTGSRALLDRPHVGAEGLRMAADPPTLEGQQPHYRQSDQSDGPTLAQAHQATLRGLIVG